MKLKLLFSMVVGLLFSMRVYSVEPPFTYDYMVEGGISNVLLMAKPEEGTSSVCYVAADRTTDPRSHYYFSSVSFSLCDFAESARYLGANVRMYIRQAGGDDWNNDVIAMEFSHSDPAWKNPPKSNH
ncbi:hypothetical protein [Pseudomonas sp. ANT_H12B]|uniref:hypothetical protein n=1 Tax=Pseudomonas sp. ANT_H12B TaxID=2597348 RepID=UPI0011ECD4E5|nr:hypothetical protein [Pseudomonas sp. ANT_H12B]KAA0967683.1 hypothetical protein FQ185_22180 [Pseudomonas sp. ANT_H12B]